MKQKVFLFLAALLIVLQGTYAQNKQEPVKGYVFNIEKQNKHTPPRDQFRSGTCWSFATAGLLEAELIRMGKPEIDLSEMFTVWHVYSDKAMRYVRMHGEFNFGGGGALNDMVDVIKKYGIIPEEAFPGLNYGEKKHVHGELDHILSAYVKAVTDNKNKKLSPAWHKGFQELLNTYFGKMPENFTYNGKTYTPQSFAKEFIPLNLDDYVMLTSFTHHPFYSKFIFEVPDNWSWGLAHNLPLDELMATIDNAINKGYCVAWASDISEKGWSWKNGVAIIPDEEAPVLDGLEKDKWENMSQTEKNEMLYKFDKPIKEKAITQDLRQEAFNNYTTTDDHGMLIVGIAKDQLGNKFYYIKNSWGTTGNPYNGYGYISENFIKYKTVNILLNKNAIPDAIRKKLNL